MWVLRATALLACRSRLPAGACRQSERLRRMKKNALAKRIFLFVTFLAILAAATWGALHVTKAATTTIAAKPDLPTTRVKKGKVVITVAARGELQGGNSETLVAPMA